VAVASAGQYASLHLAPDRKPRQHPTTQFLLVGCPTCCPTNSVKALKEEIKKNQKSKNLIIQQKCEKCHTVDQSQ